jgi:mannose-1-phosphate guanylyltransferase
MTSGGGLWALVLAAGDGRRLAALTTDAGGNAIPKQFCSLHREGSLLDDALQRARSIASLTRSCVIVAEQHRPYWQELLSSLPANNVIVQPRNCGTAHGILLATLHILERDPLAHIIFLPADHYVRDEEALARGLMQTAALLHASSQELLLLGIEPDQPDPELGYIVPGQTFGDGTCGVMQFVEKPRRGLAGELIMRGALWNSFIFGSHGATLLRLLRERMPQTTNAMSAAVAQLVHNRSDQALRSLYAGLDTVDFSRTIFTGAEARLRVVAAPSCGWTDLGTPQRVAEALQTPLNPTAQRQPLASLGPALINLARAYAQQGLRV